MSTLYNLTGDYLKVKRMEEDGVDPEVIMDTLESIDSEIEVKADNYVGFIKQIEAEIEGIKKEEKRLAELRHSKSNLINRLKENLKMTMQATGKEKFKTEFNNFWIQRNPAKLSISDDSKIPMNFIDVSIERKINRKELLKYLQQENNQAIEGVSIIESEGVRFR